MKREIPTQKQRRPQEQEQNEVTSTQEVKDKQPVTIVNGKVVKCFSLNVREESNKLSRVVEVIQRDDVVKVNIDESTEDFYAVKTKKNKGFCIKEFIEIESIENNEE